MDEALSSHIALPSIKWPYNSRIPHYPAVCGTLAERTPLLEHHFVMRSTNLDANDATLIADATMLHICCKDYSYHGRWQDIDITDKVNHTRIQFHPKVSPIKVHIPPRIVEALQVIRHQRMDELAAGKAKQDELKPLPHEKRWLWLTYSVFVLLLITAVFTAMRLTQINDIGWTAYRLVFVSSTVLLLGVSSFLLLLLICKREVVVDRWGIYQLGDYTLSNTISWQRVIKINDHKVISHIRYYTAAVPMESGKRRCLTLWNQGGKAQYDLIHELNENSKVAHEQHQWDAVAWRAFYRSVLHELLLENRQESQHQSGVSPKGFWRFDSFEPLVQYHASHSKAVVSSQSISNQKAIPSHASGSLKLLKWPMDIQSVYYPDYKPDLKARMGLFRYEYSSNGGWSYVLIADPTMLHLIINGKHYRGRWQDLSIMRHGHDAYAIRWHRRAHAGLYDIPEQIVQLLLKIQSNRRKELRENDENELNSEVLSASKSIRVIQHLLIWLALPFAVLSVLIFLEFEIALLLLSVCCLLPVYLLSAVIWTRRQTRDVRFYEVDRWGLYVYDKHTMIDDIPWPLISEIKRSGWHMELHYKKIKPYAKKRDLNGRRATSYREAKTEKMKYILGQEAANLLWMQESSDQSIAVHHQFDPLNWRAFYHENIGPLQASSASTHQLDEFDQPDEHVPEHRETSD